jgi:hypothetical protein
MSAAVEWDLMECSLPASAELVRRRDGGPMRLRRNGNLKKPMGLYFSVKLGDHVPWEARTELKACWWAEVFPDVRVYRTQPHTLKMLIDGQRVSYTPDLQLELAGGGVQILEVKSRFEEGRDPAYARKLAQASAVYDAIGYRFDVVDNGDLEQEPALSAITTLQRYRTTVVDQRSVEAVHELLSPGVSTLRRVLEVLPAGPLGLASIASMMVKRMIRLDLSVGLVGDAPVALVRPGDVGSPLFAATS